jgi:hypothetical protein
MIKYLGPCGEIVKAFQFGLEAKPAWFLAWLRDNNFGPYIELTHGDYIVLRENSIVSYSPDEFRILYEPIIENTY